MADRPDTIKEWATSPTAEIEEPTENFKKQGFGITQPSVRFFNWILNNIYKWINYFDDASLSQGEINTTFVSARPRIQLPFNFKEGNKLSQIEVFKKGTADNVGGVSGSLLSGSGSISRGGLVEGSFTYVAGEFPEIQVTLTPAIQFEYGSAFSPEATFVGNLIKYSPGVLLVVTGGGGTRIALGILILGRPRPAEGFRITNLRLDSALGNIRELVFSNLQGRFVEITDSAEMLILGDLLRDNVIYLVGAVSQSSMNLGKCIIWQIDNSNPAISWTASGVSTIDTGGIAPLFKNEEIGSLRFFRVVKSYTAQKEEFLGSSAGTTTIAGAAWNLESYSYDADTRKVEVKLTPTQTNKALFHTFKIRQGGSDMLSLNSSDAEFASGIWSWSVPADPITETGIYEVVFQTTGAGFNAFVFIKLSSGLSVETYSGVDYLHISSGIANNDEILVRKV